MAYMVGPVGIGTISGTLGGSAITGASTQFTTQLAAGDVLVFVYNGNYYGKTVASVTDNTHATISGTLPGSLTNENFYVLRNSESVFGIEPRSMWNREMVIDLSGGFQPIGYPQSVWEIGAAPVDTWFNGRSFVLSSGILYSGSCLVKTRVDKRSAGADVFGVFFARVRFPLPGEYSRYGETVGSDGPLKITFLLLSEITLL